MDKNQKGFSVIEGLLTLVIIGIIGGTGWYVWHNHDAKTKSTATTSSNRSTATKNVPTQQAFKLPDNYKYYENEDAGFKFAYPKVYQDLFGSASDANSQTLMSSNPDPVYIEGSSNAISVTIASPDTIFSTLKYGPSLKFIDGNLIVQEVNPADNLNVVGKPYKGLLQSQDVTKEVDGIKVSIITGGDEGNTYYKYAFLTKNKLVIISLPGFYDGVAICADNSCKANDKTEYDAFGTTVLYSISKI